MNDERNLGEKTDDSGQQPRYEHYQFHEEQRTVLKPSGPSGHRRNQNSFQKKAGATIALAVIFGLVAAVVFQAANFAADRFLNTGKSSVQIKTTDSVDLQETASDDSTADKVLSDSENGTVAAVAQASMPSVVAITTVSVQEIPSFFGYSSHQYKSASTGSGIIVGDNDDELLIATNNHVVSGATTLTVCFAGGDVVGAEEETQAMASGDSITDSSDSSVDVDNAVSAKIKGTDEENDLAVIAVEKSDIPEETAKAAKYMLVSYPLNPVCATANDAFYEELIAFAKKYNIIILHDNAYSDIIYGGREGKSFLSYEGAKEVGVEFYSLSKSYNLTGARISFVIGNQKIVDKFRSVRTQFDYGVFLPVQYGAAAALNGPQDAVLAQCEEYERRNQAFCGGLRSIGWDVPDSEGTMFVWAPVPKGHGTSEEFCMELMEKTGLIGVPGSSFGSLGEGFMRFALVEPVPVMQEIVKAIAESGLLKRKGE